MNDDPLISAISDSLFAAWIITSFFCLQKHKLQQMLFYETLAAGTFYEYAAG
jgi:hypothetical protein